MERIEADLLVPGRGEPVHHGVVVWDGPTITYAGPAASAPPGGQAPSNRAAAVLPGLWDCHGHLLGTRTLDLGRLPLEPVALRAARCASDLRAALDAGVTSVREVGGLGVHLARAVEEGTVDGPAIARSRLQPRRRPVTVGQGSGHRTGTGGGRYPGPGWRSWPGTGPAARD